MPDSDSRELVIASRNQDKIEEIRALLSDTGLNVLSEKELGRLPAVEEDGNTLEENAIKKAVEFMRATGLMALADDTGLEVDYLNGAPGVYSARYAGENASYADNNRKLLSELEGVSRDKRTARFRCVVAIAIPAAGTQDGECKKVHTVEGRCEGLITTSPRGTSGFGYDPIFLVRGIGKTFAELSEEEKNKLSHRGHALRKAKKLLTHLFFA